jgi:hypothetical protein
LAAGGLSDVVGVNPVIALVAVLIGMAAVVNFRNPGRERPTRRAAAL